MRDRQQLAARFRNRRQVVDGGLATELVERGFNTDGKLWSGHVLLEHPQAIEDLHFDYLVAGADIIISASYQLTLTGMAEAGYSASDARRALTTSIDLALRARERWVSGGFAKDRSESPLIAASIGPYGAYLADGSEYTGDYRVSCRDLEAFHLERVQLLAQTEADLLAFETIPSLLEALAITNLLSACGNPPAWISFSCRDGEHLSDGTVVVEAAERVFAHYPDLVAVGVNCTAPRHVESVLGGFARHCDTALIAYPNSGEGWDAEERKWIAEHDATAFSDYAKRWIDAGANLIGGCCRTSPSHITGLRALLEARS
jgi:homocysteine S-methyltransferase